MLQNKRMLKNEKIDEEFLRLLFPPLYILQCAIISSYIHNFLFINMDYALKKAEKEQAPS